MIVDAGATKVRWCVMMDNVLVRDFETQGVNPNYMPIDLLRQVVVNEAGAFVRSLGIHSIYYYGAGCAAEENRQKVHTLLCEAVPEAKHIEVHTDLMGAARALCGRHEGIACIMGTGSNSCLYDGREVVENVRSGGWLFGDEGGGCDIGLNLLRSYIKGTMPMDIRSAFETTYPLRFADILHNVYAEPKPNVFMASFCPFVSERLSHPFLRNMVKECFRKFFREQVVRYTDQSGMNVGFVGSVARAFAAPLCEVAEEQGFIIGKILASPMAGLLDFHSAPAEEEKQNN